MEKTAGSDEDGDAAVVTNSGLMADTAHDTLSMVCVDRTPSLALSFRPGGLQTCRDLSQTQQPIEIEDDLPFDGIATQSSKANDQGYAL